MKITYMGEPLKVRTYTRHKGKFAPRMGFIGYIRWSVRMLGIIVTCAMFLAFAGTFSMWSDPEFFLSTYVAHASEVVKPYTELDAIADCESGGGKKGGAHQFNKDGSVVMNPKTNDVGYFQINLDRKYDHVRRASKLGYDILTEEGNRAYAKWLYEHEGTKPWNSSKTCWSKML